MGSQRARNNLGNREEAGRGTGGAKGRKKKSRKPAAGAPEKQSGPTKPTGKTPDKPTLTAADLLQQGLVTEVFNARSKKFIETRLSNDALVLLAQRHLQPMDVPSDRMDVTRLRKVIHESVRA